MGLLGDECPDAIQLHRIECQDAKQQDDEGNVEGLMDMHRQFTIEPPYEHRDEEEEMSAEEDGFVHPIAQPQMDGQIDQEIQAQHLNVWILMDMQEDRRQTKEQEHEGYRILPPLQVFRGTKDLLLSYKLRGKGRRHKGIRPKVVDNLVGKLLVVMEISE